MGTDFGLDSSEGALLPPSADAVCGTSAHATISQLLLQAGPSRRFGQLPLGQVTWRSCESPTSSRTIRRSRAERKHHVGERTEVTQRQDIRLLMGSYSGRIAASKLLVKSRVAAMYVSPAFQRWEGNSGKPESRRDGARAPARSLALSITHKSALRRRRRLAPEVARLSRTCPELVEGAAGPICFSHTPTAIQTVPPRVVQNVPGTLSDYGRIVGRFASHTLQIWAQDGRPIKPFRSKHRACHSGEPRYHRRRANQFHNCCSRS